MVLRLFYISWNFSSHQFYFADCIPFLLFLLIRRYAVAPFGEFLLFGAHGFSHKPGRSLVEGFIFWWSLVTISKAVSLTTVLKMVVIVLTLVCSSHGISSCANLSSITALKVCATRRFHSVSRLSFSVVYFELLILLKLRRKAIRTKSWSHIMSVFGKLRGKNCS